MKRLISIVLNFAFLGAVILAAIVVTTIGITKKVNDYTTEYKKGIQGSVIKQVIPVLSFQNAIVRKILVQEGDEVKKGQVIIQLSNTLLQSKVDALKQYTDNVSAQTEAQVGEAQLKSLDVASPVDGIVGTIPIVEGSSIDSFSTLLTLYSFNNERLLVDFTTEQYKQAEQLDTITAYSPRLNQSFVIIPDKLKPDEDQPKQNEIKKIGMYFNFKNQSDSKTLLNNEDLQVSLNKNDSTESRPIDVFVKFWNGLLASKSSTNEIQ